MCCSATSPAGCSLTTTTLSDGGYDLRAVAIDQAGNPATSALVANRVVDNTAPRGVDIQTTNAPGGTLGKPEPGDLVNYVFSETIKPASVLASWTGVATTVTVRSTNANPEVLTVWDAANTTQLALGSVTLGRKYITANTTFTGSSMVQSGNTISVTLGTPSGATATVNGTGTLQWTTPSAATDCAGNPVIAATVVESGAADADFLPSRLPVRVLQSGARLSPMLNEHAVCATVMPCRRNRRWLRDQR